MIKIRCSSLPALMTNSRSKNGDLSETAKAMIREKWIEDKYNRVRLDKSSKYTDKGIEVESDSLELVGNELGTPLFKNNKELSNSYLTGTPDVILKDRVIDIKSSWDIWTYNAVDEKKAHYDYYWQLVGYMILTKTRTAWLTYALVNTPEPIINDELYRLSFKLGESNEIQEKIRRNYIFDDIPAKDRVKPFTYSLTVKQMAEAKRAIRAKVRLANDFYKTLAL